MRRLPFYFALALFSLTAALFAQEQSGQIPNVVNSNQQGIEQHEETDRGEDPHDHLSSDPSSSASGILFQPSEPADHESQVSRPSDNEEINVQKGIRNAAYVSAGAAVVSILVVGAGTVLLLYTLKETRNATKAAQDAIKVTQSVTRDQSRAYIHVEKAELTWGNSFGEHPRIVLTAVNSGHTPAKWFEIASVCRANSVDAVGTAFSRTEIAARRTLRWHGFLAGGEQGFPGISSEEDFEELKGAYISGDSFENKRPITITVYGTLRYCTFYDEIFVSDFCFERPLIPRYREIKREVWGVEKDSSGIPINLIETSEKPALLPKVPREGMRTYYEEQG